MKILLYFVLILFLFLLGPLWLWLTGEVNLNGDWRTADRQSAHLAPTPKAEPSAVVQVYAARAFNWHGLFAVHTWIAVKPKDARQYTVYQVVGWRMFQHEPVVSIQQDIPDGYWYGSKPVILTDIRGKLAETAIPKIEQAAKAYPYAAYYNLWPGPNSNTFIAFIARRVPELELVLPTTALGKDYLGPGLYWGKTTSGTGYQLSLSGLFGISLAHKEGLEVNLLGLNLGIGYSPLVIKLPGIGVIPSATAH